MNNIKQKFLKKLDYLLYFLVLVFITCNAFVMKDSKIALLSALCGISYSFLAGKRRPICYIFGLCGSFMYSWLSLKNALWGNLLLYLLYYIPMQVFGFIQWNKNLEENSSVIKRESLNKKESITLTYFTIVLTAFAILVLYFTHDKHPFIDGITTIFSIAGMYLTVKRCIEQWLVWMVVNGLSFLMWLSIVMTGAHVYSTVIMWAVYFILAIYFFADWKMDTKLLIAQQEVLWGRTNKED